MSITAAPTLLQQLLTERHLASHGEFIREYNRVAALVAPENVGRGPTKSQYYRWIHGELVTLPRGFHCRILEAMFLGWTVDQLFAEPDNAFRPPYGEFSFTERAFELLLQHNK